MLTVACTIRQGSRSIGLSDKLSLNATSGSGQAQVLERSDGVHLLGCLSLQSMLAGLPEQAGIKFETPQNMQTAGLDRSQLVVQRQGDFIAVLHATTVQAVIHCHCAGDLDMPAASHHSKAQHSPATTPQQSLVNHSTAQLSTMIRSAAQKKHVITSAQHALSPWWQDKHKHVKLHCWQTGLQERQIKLLCLSKTSPKDSFHCLHTPSQNLDLARALNEPGGPSCTQRHAVAPFSFLASLQVCITLTANQQWAYHKMGLNSLAHLLLSSVTHNLVLAHKGDTVADGGCLAKANRPPDCVLLQGSKVAFNQWHHSIQVRLQITGAGQSMQCKLGCKAEDQAVGISSSIALWAVTDSHNLLLPALLSTGSWMRLCW